MLLVLGSTAPGCDGHKGNFLALESAVETWRVGSFQEGDLSTSQEEGRGGSCAGWGTGTHSFHTRTPPVLWVRGKGTQLEGRLGLVGHLPQEGEAGDAGRPQLKK